MYRYHFDIPRSVWLLQFLKLGLFWVTARRAISGPGTDVFEDITFDNTAELDEYVTLHGIDRVYRRMAHPTEREPLFYVPGAR